MNANTGSRPLQCIGGGKMGQALMSGAIDAGWIAAEHVTIVEVDAAARDQLVQSLPGVTVTDQPIAHADTLVAVKPHLVTVVLADLPTPARVLSIAAGTTCATIESAVPPGTPVIRVMPNTPALLGVGAAGVAPGSAATDDDVAWAVSMMQAVGAAEIVTEAQLDAVTGLSGSGPAYFFLMAEALVDGGVAAGLPRSVALTLAHQTMAGAAAMLTETDTPASELRASVTTPNGTTAAGLRVLEQRGVRAALIDAVVAATDRATELGRQ